MSGCSTSGLDGSGYGQRLAWGFDGRMAIAMGGMGHLSSRAAEGNKIAMPDLFALSLYGYVNSLRHYQGTEDVTIEEQYRLGPLSSVEGLILGERVMDS